MIAGIGVDLCIISRVVKAAENEHFSARVFSQEERHHAQRNGAKSLASCFAAREAFIKASGESFMSVMFGHNFELVRAENGAPSVKLHGELAEKWQDAKIFVSLSHDGDYVCAMIVIDKN